MHLRNLFSAVNLKSLSVFSVIRTLLVFAMSTCRVAARAPSNKKYVRADGVTMGYDPYEPRTMEKYGAPGKTDQEGFNPYSDSVGAGIYGGRVERDENGDVRVGAQYQNHNPVPGPVYAGGGYTPMVNAVHDGEDALKELIDKYPELVNDISTGGAQPLHMCGMSRDGQLRTAYLIARGGDIEAVDTYGYRPLHRMASNNLALGAEALLAGGAQVDAPTGGGRGETALSIARSAGAADVVKVLAKYI